ncbi:MAG: DUF480 domain-containing protein [Candidatus Cloacimonetes bacterium]|nr:DUF480 domain-containing protein [Candidatus Cloacimonadota bacterium]
MSTPLQSVEMRILGALIEKRLSTPEYYPLTANSLQAACNQKSNRDPVLELDATQVEQGLASLRARQLVSAVSGAGQRSGKYMETFCERNALNPREQALLAELLLRGPQTPGELRSRSSRMAELGSLDEVHALLDSLANRDTPFVHQMDRLPGKSERRWCQLLGGMVEEAGASDPPAPALGAPWTEELDELRSHVQDLQQQLAALRDEFARFKVQFE